MSNITIYFNQDTSICPSYINYKTPHKMKTSLLLFIWTIISLHCPKCLNNK